MAQDKSQKEHLWSQQRFSRISLDAGGSEIDICVRQEGIRPMFARWRAAAASAMTRLVAFPVDGP